MPLLYLLYSFHTLLNHILPCSLHIFQNVIYFKAQSMKIQNSILRNQTITLTLNCMKKKHTNFTYINLHFAALQQTVVIPCEFTILILENKNSQLTIANESPGITRESGYIKLITLVWNLPVPTPLNMYCLASDECSTMSERLDIESAFPFSTSRGKNTQ